MKVRPTTTARHTVTVVHAGKTVVYRLDLEPAYTIWYTPAAAAAVGAAVVMVYADDTTMRYADDTAMEYAA